MNKIRLGFLLLFLTVLVQAQITMTDCVITKIQKPVRNYTLQIDLSTPFNSYLTREYISYSGKNSLWQSISTYEFRNIFDPEAKDKQTTEQEKERVLNRMIEECIVYKDKTGVIISYDSTYSGYLLNSVRNENGRWVNSGQDLKSNLEEAQKKALQLMDFENQSLPVIEKIQQMPDDITSFVNYIEKNGQSPKSYLLSKLARHRLVIYGEYHRRKPSWDLLKTLIKDKQFARTTGTVYIEMASYMQPRMDQFFAEDSINHELLLNMFRDTQLFGWWDKNEYEFLIDLWKLNKTLKPSRKIKVILADYQLPFNEIQDKEDIKNHKQIDRNLNMANIIEDEIKSTKDKRSHLFIVGCGHAFRSENPGFASTPRGQEQQFTAGAQLSKRLPADDLFILFQHCIASDNGGQAQSLLRGGIFDKAFLKTGNQPIAFDLKNSPFGNEPFDGIAEITFSAKTGCYADNYDGYLFLQPLSDEPKSEPFYELCTDAFVEEMKRRAPIFDIRYNFGRKIEDLTKDYIHERIKPDAPNKKNYDSHLFEPLNKE